MTKMTPKIIIYFHEDSESSFPLISFHKKEMTIIQKIIKIIINPKSDKKFPLV